MTMLGDSVRRRQGRRANAQRRPPRGGRPPWLKWLPAAIAAVMLPFVIGYIFAVYVLFPPPDTGAAGVPVPELVGLPSGEAQQVLNGAGLGPLEVVELPHPTHRPGTVIAQSPLTGQQLQPGAVVRVAVSSGRPRGIVPDVVGFQVERAFSLLTRLGFQVERRLEESDAPEGRVLRVDPQPGLERDLPALVTLTVSAGLPPPEPWDEPADTVPPPGGAASGPPPDAPR